MSLDVPEQALPLAPSARRATLFAVILIAINALTNLLGRLPASRVVVTGDEFRTTQLLFAVFAYMTRAAILGLVIAAIVFAVRTPRETKSGAYRGRGGAIAVLVLCGVMILGLIYFVVSEAIAIIQVLQP